MDQRSDRIGKGDRLEDVVDLFDNYGIEEPDDLGEDEAEDETDGSDEDDGAE